MKKKVWSKSYIKNRTFLRTMLISIVTLICIPLVLVQILLIKQFADDFDATNAESYQSALRTNAESFQSQIDLLSYNAVKISLDSTAGLPGSEDVSDYSIKLAADAVKNYGIGLPLSATVGVYYRVNDCYIYNGNKKHWKLFAMRLESRTFRKENIWLCSCRKLGILNFLQQIPTDVSGF